MRVLIIFAIDLYTILITILLKYFDNKMRMLILFNIS